MTPKEKALERFRHYLLAMPVNNGMSANDEISLAIFCVKSECDEIIDSHPCSPIKGNMKEFYQEVKREIEKL